MSRKAPQITCSEQERKVLERLAASRTESRQMVERARIVLCCLSGKQVQCIAKECKTRANTVIKWRERFVAARIAGLADAPRPGARKKYDANFSNQVLSTLESPPPDGQATWNGTSVAKPFKAPSMRYGEYSAKRAFVSSGNVPGASVLIKNLRQKRRILSGSTWIHRIMPW